MGMEYHDLNLTWVRRDFIQKTGERRHLQAGSCVAALGCRQVSKALCRQGVVLARVGHAGARLLNAASNCVYVEYTIPGVICKPVGERPQKHDGDERELFFQKDWPNSDLGTA